MLVQHLPNIPSIIIDTNSIEIKHRVPFSTNIGGKGCCPVKRWVKKRKKERVGWLRRGAGILSGRSCDPPSWPVSVRPSPCWCPHQVDTSTVRPTTPPHRATGSSTTCADSLDIVEFKRPIAAKKLKNWPHYWRLAVISVRDPGDLNP